mmetsp:Transcript_47729/g.85943  ORF Transcript_47729/g.85943 Transcript_47729/m.85943 type:complete len:94 (-) Transcript_47729:22-303(-)
MWEPLAESDCPQIERKKHLFGLYHSLQADAAPVSEQELKWCPAVTWVAALKVRWDLELRCLPCLRQFLTFSSGGLGVQELRNRGDCPSGSLLK